MQRFRSNTPDGNDFIKQTLKEIKEYLLSGLSEPFDGLIIIDLPLFLSINIGLCYGLKKNLSDVFTLFDYEYHDAKTPLQLVFISLRNPYILLILSSLKLLTVTKEDFPEQVELLHYISLANRQNEYTDGLCSVE